MSFFLRRVPPVNSCQKPNFFMTLLPENYYRCLSFYEQLKKQAVTFSIYHCKISNIQYFKGIKCV